MTGTIGCGCKQEQTLSETNGPTSAPLHPLGPGGRSDLPEQGAPAASVPQDSAPQDSAPQDSAPQPTTAVSALAAQFDTLLAGAPLGIGIFDRDCRHVRVNAVLAQMNGRPAKELAGRTPSEVNGEVGLQAEELYRQVMADGVPMRGVRLSGEVSARPGDVRHWDLTFHPVRQHGPGNAQDGAVVGLCVIVDDVTVETQLTDQVAAASARIEQITESMAVGYLAMDAEWRITYLNAQAVTALGRPREELMGGIIWELFPATAGTAFEAGYRRARTSGHPFTFDAYYPPPLDAWYEVRATPEGDGVALYFTDITARVEAQRAAEAAVRRAQLLAVAADRLAGLSDAEEALAVLPQLLVPAVADWAVVSTVDGAAAATAAPFSAAGSTTPGERERRAGAGLARMRDVAFHHRDPTMVGWLAQYALSRLDAHRLMPARAVSPVIAGALVEGQAWVITEDATQAVLSTLPTDAEDPAVQALTALAPASAVAMPLVSRGRTVGMLDLYWSASDATSPPDPADPVHAADDAGQQSASPRGRSGATPVGELGMDPVATRTALAATGPTPEVVDLVRAVADRAASAVDAIAAAQRQVEIAAELQRSLLTAPPEPDHAHIVVRYVPAAAAAQVGGDWYDAFLQPTQDGAGAGATVLVIGDVLGHDISAAAAMGQVRTLVRAAAVMTGSGPAQVLSATDAAMGALAVGTTATAVVARLEQDADQVARAVTTLRWSSAGHPPPLVLGPDGSVRLLSASGGDVGNSDDGPEDGEDDGGGGDSGESDLLLGVLPDLARHEHTVEVARGSTVLLYTDGLVERRGESLGVGLQRLVETAGEVAAFQRAGDLPDGVNAFCDEVLGRMLASRPSDDVALIAVRLHPQDRPRPAEAGGRRLPGWVVPEPQVQPRAGQPDRA